MSFAVEGPPPAGAGSLPCRLILDGPLAGDRNMNVDGLLLHAGVQGEGALRFYRWSEATVSLGHFQAGRGEPLPERFRLLPSVRRLSGGGAILHDRELTYSCVLPAAHPAARNPGSLYDLVHRSIIDVLDSFGIESRMRGAEAFEDRSFLCFSRGDARDIVIDRHKIVGSAQRRRQGAVLQHGSILLGRSEHASEFPGIRELTGLELNPENLMLPLSAALSRALSLEFLE